MTSTFLQGANLYALASGLVGFSSSTLRVRVTEIRDGYAWVVTADLLSAGVPLTLDASQIKRLDEASEIVVADWITAGQTMNGLQDIGVQNASAKARADGKIVISIPVRRGSGRRLR